MNGLFTQTVEILSASRNLSPLLQAGRQAGGDLRGLVGYSRRVDILLDDEIGLSLID